MSSYNENKIRICSSIYNDNNKVIELITDNINENDISILIDKLKLSYVNQLNLSFYEIKNLNELLNTINSLNNINILKITCYHKEDVNLLLNFLKNNKNITSFKLNFNYPDYDDDNNDDEYDDDYDEQFKSIQFIDYNLLSDVIKNNNTLKILDLGHCLINDDIKIISDSLKINSSLEEIELMYNYITNIDFIFDVLIVNKSIKEFSAMQCYIKSVDVSLIYEFIKYNNVIQHIFLNNDKLEYNDSIKNQLTDINKIKPVLFSYF